MSKNFFYEKKGPFPLKEIIKTIGYTGNFSDRNKALKVKKRIESFTGITTWFVIVSDK